MVEHATGRGGGCGPQSRQQLIKRAKAGGLKQIDQLLERKRRLSTIRDPHERRVEELFIEMAESRYADQEAATKSMEATHRRLQDRGE